MESEHSVAGHWQGSFEKPPSGVGAGIADEALAGAKVSLGWYS